MSKEQDALKLALECIERGGGIKEGNTVYLHDRELMRIARDALRKALAAPAQHSASVLEQNTSNSLETTNQEAQQQEPGRNHWEDGDVFERIAARKKQPAQPSKPWVGLTDEERDDCKVISIEQTCLAIEAKLKEKNA